MDGARTGASSDYVHENALMLFPQSENRIDATFFCDPR